MREVELLAAKAIKHVAPAKIGLSCSLSGGTFQLRTSFMSDVFNFLYEPLAAAMSPRADVLGASETGFSVSLSRNGRVQVAALKNTVSIRVGARFLNVAENKIPQRMIDVLSVEFDDGSRCLVTAPLPPEFLSSKTREKLKNTPPTPLKLYENAFKHLYGVEFGQVAQERQNIQRVEQPPEPAPEPLVEQPTPTPERATHLTVATGVADQAPSAPRQVTDLKELIEMINEQVAAMRKEPGANVDLRIEDGRVRASVQVIYQQDL